MDNGAQEGERPSVAVADCAENALVPEGARVLLIEDEPGIVDFVRRGLEAEGFAVEATHDGLEGERLA